MTGELVSAVNQMQLVNELTPSYLQPFEKQITGSALIIADCNLPPATIYWLTGLPGRPALFFDGVSIEKITRLQPYLDRIDGLKCNWLEAEALLHCSVHATPDQLVAMLHQRGIETILLSLGEEGVQLGRAGRQTHHPLPAPTQTITSVTGAGDALLAGFLHSYHRGANDEVSMNLGLRAAQLSLACTGAVNPDIAKLHADQPGAV